MEQSNPLIPTALLNRLVYLLSVHESLQVAGGKFAMATNKGQLELVISAAHAVTHNEIRQVCREILEEQKE